MSLINDALKKAQRQREDSGVTPPGAMPPPSTSVANPSLTATPSQAAKNNVALIIAGAAVIVSLSVAATVYFLRNDARSEPKSGLANTPPKASPAPAHPAQVALPPPSGTVLPASPAPGGADPGAAALKTNGPGASAPGSASAPPSATVVVADPVPLATVPSSLPQIPPPSGQTAPPLVVAAPTGPGSPAPDGTAVKSTYRIQGLVDKFRISGIRLSDTDSKVLLNDHLFRVNDLVEASLGLRLTAIESHVLTFTDADGNVYLKHF